VAALYQSTALLNCLKEHSGFDMERVDLSFRAFLLAV
jgi:hypothetical protein